VASADITNKVSGSTVTHELLPTGVTATTYSNATVTVDSKGRITGASNGTPGGGTTNYYTTTNNFSISTNNLGYLERNATVTTISESDGEVSPWTITIPANTLALDGDEVNIHMGGTLTIYASGGDNGYSWRLVSDSSASPVNASELSTTNRYFSSFGDPARSVDWNFAIKRVGSNVVFITTTHSVGPGTSLLNSMNASTNLVTSTMTRLTTLSGELGTTPIDFSFYADIADDARAATLLLYGYLVHKVGAASPNSGDVVGPASSVAGELAIFADGTGKVLRSSGSFLVAQSNFVAVGSVTNYVADLSLAPMQFLAATNDVNFLHATNATAGRSSTLLIQASGANRTVLLPSNLKRTKTSVVVTNGSVMPINFYAWGSANSNVIATIGTEGF
jgi:hypothetical protein